MRRYSAWHKTEPGYSSEAEVQEWIDRQDNPEEYIITATDDDYTPRPDQEAEENRTRTLEIERAYLSGKKYEKWRLACSLGLK